MTTALGYHLDTAHVRNRPMGRTINWHDQPVPFKLYRDTPVFSLTQQLSLPDIALSDALRTRPLNPKTAMPTLIAGVCNLTAGLTRIKRQADNLVFHFRTVPSAGALYPTELYVALQNVNGMNDGLYHFCPLEHTITPLRKGQIFSALTGGEPIIRFYLTSIFHRSAWKYGGRAYRYCLLDAGHMVENLFIASRMYGLTPQIDYDFDDDFINDFLLIDPKFEGCVAQVHALGCGPSTSVYDTVPPVMPGLPQFSKCARSAEAPAELLQVHAACSVPAHGIAPAVPPPATEITRLPEPDMPASASASMHKRTSARNFVPRDGHTHKLVDTLGWLCEGRIDDPWASLLQVGFLAGNKSGLTPGFHALDPRTRSTTLTTPGDFMRQSAHICLDQEWLANAALHLAFTADLESLEAHIGPRAYRYAHLEAGRLGQRTYLAGTANNLGTCGIGAYFDHEANTLLGLQDGHHLLYLVATGPAKR